MIWTFPVKLTNKKEAKLTRSRNRGQGKSTASGPGGCSPPILGCILPPTNTIFFSYKYNAANLPLAPKQSPGCIRRLCRWKIFPAFGDQSRGSGFAHCPIFVRICNIKAQDTSTWFIKVSFLEGSINLTFDGAHFAVSKLVGWGELGGLLWVATRALGGLLLSPLTTRALATATNHKLPPAKSSKKDQHLIKKSTKDKQGFCLPPATNCHQLIC